MAIKDLPKYKDIRGSIRRKGRYPIAKVGSKTGIAAKDTHVVHHSLTLQHLAGANPHAFANYHIDTNGWQGCAYALVIMPDGTIYHCDDFDRRTNHAGNTNDRSVGTCLVGDFRKGMEKPTQAQMLSLYLVNKELYKECPNMFRTIGHQECPGYAWKNCPGDNWNYKDVIAGKGFTINPTPSTPKPTPGTYTVQQGDTLWSIAKGMDGVTVEDIIKANPGIKPTELKIGQVIKVNGSTPVKEQPKPSTPAPAKPEPVKGDTSNAGKRVESKVDRLRYYKQPSWDDKHLAGYVDQKLGFTIIERIKVGTGNQYKVRNAKGEIYYITASSTYVKVIDTKAVAQPKPPVKNVGGIPVVGKIKIVNVGNAAYICDRPSSTGSVNLGTIKLGQTIEIAGSVSGWFEVIYKGKRAYVNAKYGKRV